MRIRRFCAIFLIALLAVISSTALAESGWCGDNLSWEKLNGQLGIWGTGPMYNYSASQSNSDAPWYSRTDVVHLVMDDGPTSIGSYAFGWCMALRDDFTIPTSVTSIGDHAFCYCHSLNNVTIPSGVRSIGTGCFYRCDGLQSVKIPSGVSTIRTDTFAHCGSLQKVYMPTSVTSIGNSAFDASDNLQAVYYSGSQSQWNSISIGSNNTPLLNATIYFNYTPYHTVYFDANGGTVSTASKTVTDGGSYGTLPVPTRSGYAFVGWYTSVSSGSRIWDTTTVDLSGDQTLYARWDQYTLSYNANGGSGAPSSQTGTSVTIPSTIPSRFGYNFMGWVSSASATSPVNLPGETISLTSNRTLYAYWRNATAYTQVTSVNTSMKIDIAGAPRYLYIVPSASGTYVFQSDGSYDTIGTLYDANGNQLSTNDDGGENHNFSISYDLSANTGYYLKAALYSGTATSDSFSVRMDKVAIEYTVTYNANGGSGAPSAQKKTQSVTLTLSNTVPTRYYTVTFDPCDDIGMTSEQGIVAPFTGWNTESNGSGTSYASGGSYNADASVTLYAQWGSAVLGTLSTPTRSGYTFDGWYTAESGGTRVTSSTRISYDIALYAHWTYSPASYTVTFNANGGSVNTSSKIVTNGSTYGTLPTPTRSDYSFDGWYTASSGGTRITSSTTVSLTANQTLYAHWTYSPASYTVTFNANGGSVSTSSRTVTNGSTYGSLPTPTRAGYTFDGWYTASSGGTKITSSTTVSLAGNQTLYAHWNANSYTVTFNANGGSVSTSSKTVTNGSTYGSLPTPTRADYSFDGWYTASSGGTRITSSTTVSLTANQTLYAHWTYSPASYTVTFNANGGSVSTSSKTVTNGSAYGSLPTPTRTDYRFDGWFTASSGGTQITSATTVNLTANQTLYAHWTRTYIVTYDANGGTGVPSPQTKIHNESLTLSTYRPTKSYTIQYNANGGSVAPASKSVSCSFGSWRGNGVSYAPGDTYTSNSSVTLYAQWTDPVAGALATPKRTGYTFAGWYTAASGGTQVTSSTTIAGSRTIYAHWNKAGYTMGVDTYSFDNFSDWHADGHCYGMSMTSSGYYIGALSKSRIGGNSSTPLYSFNSTSTVLAPICYYQRAQGEYREEATVAGGSHYLYGYYNTRQDWQEVIAYVQDHSYDNTGVLQIGLRNDEGGHAINFLRYENVNGQDRIYAYDNNFPEQETYFYLDSSGYIQQTPVRTFRNGIRCIALRDTGIFFNSVGDFDVTHALYMINDAATVQGYTGSLMDADFPDEAYMMYEVPQDQDQVIIVPNRDYADFIYMDTEYSFGEIADETYGVLKFATMDEGAITDEAVFQIFGTESIFGEPDFTLPDELTEIGESAFERIAAETVYVPDTCRSIGAYAFRNSGVKKIRVPADCTIASTAFYGCAEVRIFGATGSPAETFCKTHGNCIFVEEVQN